MYEEGTMNYRLKIGSESEKLFVTSLGIHMKAVLHLHTISICLLIMTPYQSCTRGGPRAEKEFAGRSGPHDPTTMTTDLSCFSLSRVREYLIKWKFVITHLHQFTETQFHERIP